MSGGGSGDISGCSCLQNRTTNRVQTEELRTLSATAHSLYKLKGRIVGLKLKQFESTKPEKMKIFHLLKIRKCGQVQLCVAGIREPDKIQTEHQHLLERPALQGKAKSFNYEKYLKLEQA